MYLYLILYIYICALSDWPGRQIKPLTEILEDGKLKLLGHVLRRGRQHPLHQAAFPTRSAPPRETEHRRRGRPQQFWTTNNGSKAWEVIKTHDATQPQIPFDKNNRSIRERLFEQAQRYQPPFNKGNPIWNMQCESFARCDTFTQCETFLSVTPLLSVKLLLGVTPSLSVKLLLSVKFLLHGKISFQYTTEQWARP